MNDTPVIDMLKKTAESGGSRFCMPGHKGKGAFLSEEVNKFDITELSGADNLYNPDGVILESEQNYARYIGAKDSFFLVNGSSGGVHAAILSVLNPGDEIIAARDFHLSAAHTFALAGVNPHFAHAGMSGSGMFNVIGVREIGRAIAEFPDSKAVYITYPDYWGRCLDLRSICRAAHSAGMKVICDAAHAAAFDYSDELPLSPAKAGCDIWTVSLHKTLPAMNQCAVLCTGADSGIDRSAVQSRLNLIQTTSPSYILLASSDYALSYMRKNGSRRLTQVIALIRECENRIAKLGGYKCLSCEFEPDADVYEYDILKLAIDVSEKGLTGFEVANKLEQAGIYVEAADLKRILLICGAADEKKDFDRLITALSKIEAARSNIREDFDAYDADGVFNIKLKTGIREAVFAPREKLIAEEATGRISAVCAGAYPPGIPVLIPGQEITEEAVDYLRRMKSLGYSLFGIDKTVDVVAEQLI